MAFYDEWSEEYRDELKDAGAQFSGNVPISGLNKAMQTVEGTYDEETDTGFTETGTGSFLATVNPRYQAQSEAVESEDYQRFVEYLELRRPEALARHGALELWNQNQRGLASGTPLFADQQGLIAGGTDGTGDTGGVGGTGGDSSIRADMQSAFYAALRQAGMDKTTIDDLWAWAETEWTNDPSFTAERALIGMYDQQAFKDRFKGIDLMTQGGTGRRDLPTPGEYIRFEKYVAGELSRVGVVETDFDTLIANLYVNSVSDTEVTERLNVAQKVMWDMPPEVRDKLTDWFGDSYGTSITMKTFLDNTGDWSKIQDDISTARTGGWGQMVAGLDAGWDKDLAKKVSDLGLSQAEQWSRFAELKEQEMLFSENLDETVDLDYATQGVEAAFDLDNNDLSETIDRRATGRTAKFSGGGGALLSGTTTGFGAANA